MLALCALFLGVCSGVGRAGEAEPDYAVLSMPGAADDHDALTKWLAGDGRVVKTVSSLEDLLNSSARVLVLRGGRTSLGAVSEMQGSQSPHLRGRRALAIGSSAVGLLHRSGGLAGVGDMALFRRSGFMIRRPDVEHGGENDDPAPIFATGARTRPFQAFYRGLLEAAPSSLRSYGVLLPEGTHALMVRQHGWLFLSLDAPLDTWSQALRDLVQEVTSELAGDARVGPGAVEWPVLKDGEAVTRRVLDLPGEANWRLDYRFRVQSPAYVRAVIGAPDGLPYRMTLYGMPGTSIHAYETADDGGDSAAVVYIGPQEDERPDSYLWISIVKHARSEAGEIRLDLSSIGEIRVEGFDRPFRASDPGCSPEELRRLCQTLVEAEDPSWRRALAALESLGETGLQRVQVIARELRPDRRSTVEVALRRSKAATSGR